MQDVTRLTEAIKKLKDNNIIETQGQIAIDLGYKREQTISDMVTGKAKVTTKFVTSFCNRYGIRSEWWENGEEPMFNSDLQESTTDYNVKEGKKKEIITLGKHVPLRLKPGEYEEAFGDWQGLPMYNEPVTASFVETYRDERAHQPQYYLHDPRFRDCDFGAIITGDSMHSEIRHGDFVACKGILDWSYITFGDIYYIVTKNGMETCKYIQRFKKGIKPDAVKSGSQGGRYDELDIIYDESRVLLVPYNRAIDPSPIAIDMIQRLYKVRGIVRGY